MLRQYYILMDKDWYRKKVLSISTKKIGKKMQNDDFDGITFKLLFGWFLFRMKYGILPTRINQNHTL